VGGFFINDSSIDVEVMVQAICARQSGGTMARKAATTDDRQRFRRDVAQAKRLTLSKPQTVTARASKACSGGYVHAALPWGHKCLRRGQFCKGSRDRAYHRYGFHCHRRDARGNYHLS
jgi:hypothetical protein